MDRNQSTIEQQCLDQARLEANGMYSSQFEKDACGMGFVVNIKGKKSHDIIDDGLRILERLEHRGGAGADKDTGDGAGILVQIPHEFFKRECEVLGINLPSAGDYGVGMVFAHKYEVSVTSKNAFLKRLFAKKAKLFSAGVKYQLMVQRLVKRRLPFDLG